MDVQTLVVNFIDLIWIPVAWLVARPKQRPFALFFVLICAASMRLQIAIIHDTGHSDGFIPFFWDSDVKLRATIIYGVFCAVYFGLLAMSPRARWPVLLSAGIVVYFTAFTVSMLMMAI